MDHSFFNVCDQFLRLNKICINHASFKKQLYTQDSYPSLNAFTNILSANGVEHRALRIGWEQLVEYGPPVMLHYQDRRSYFVIATHVTENEITYYKSDLHMKTESREQFLKHWNGVTLYVIEPESVSWKCLLGNEFKKHRLQLLLATICLFLFSLLETKSIEQDIFLSAFFLLKIIGLLFSVFLLRHDWGKKAVPNNSSVQ